MVSSRLINLIPIGFFLAVIITVFVQIETVMTEEGIASGGPYDNAATYPRIVAFFLGAVLCIQPVTELFKAGPGSQSSDAQRPDVVRAGLMLVVFAGYVLVLTTIGYHLATTPMICAVMWLCGMRKFLVLGGVSLTIATSFAFIFERFLNVVLPLGIWNIFIPW